jgi:hypothetical protein
VGYGAFSLGSTVNLFATLVGHGDFDDDLVSALVWQISIDVVDQILPVLWCLSREFIGNLIVLMPWMPTLMHIFHRLQLDALLALILHLD